MSARTYGEIVVWGDLALTRRYPFAGEHTVTFLDDVLRQLDEAARLEVRTLLLVVNCIGGELGAGLVLYDALASFRERGGAVVAYVPRAAFSTAAILILGADFVVVNPQAEVIVHGAAAFDRGTELEVDASVSGAALAHGNALSGAILAARTLIPRAEATRYTSTPFVWETRQPAEQLLNAARLCDLGYADFIGEEQLARELASMLVDRKRIASPRSRALEGRPTPEPLPSSVEQVRAIARRLRTEFAL